MENNILAEITLVISFIILTIMIAFMISGIISFVNAVRYRIKQRKIEKMIHIYKFNFSDFGGKCVKPTYLWGDFNTMIVKGPFTPESEIKRFDELSMSELPQLPEGYNLDIDHCKRAAQRSIYPEAFCQAFFEANR